MALDSFLQLSLSDMKFIHHQDAILIAEFQKVLTIWIMRSADMVHSELLHEFQSLLDGTWIGGSTQGTEGMMVGSTRWNCHPWLILMVSRTVAKLDIGKSKPLSSNEAKSILGTNNRFIPVIYLNS